MNIKEFEAFKRSIAMPVIEFKHGEIDSDKLYKRMCAVLGKETFDETEKLLYEDGKK
ncbi:MAG: hypothetical protein FWF82_02850 [Oscillospiraceae bacterium]|nr:hypothetical protein [Oscillospiraceae bacterium]